MSVPRALTPADADVYAEFRREMLLDSPWAYVSSPGDDPAANPSSMRESLARPCNAILVVEEGGRLSASAGVMRDVRLKRSHLAHIWGVYVTPGARGQGLGRAVVAAAIGMARGWPGIESVRLSVSGNAPAARKLYESLGFVVWGTEPAGLRENGRTHTEYHMHLPLG